MITKFQIFEDHSDKLPKVGDWVIVESTKTYLLHSYDLFYHFIHNNIGHICSEINKDEYLIKYFNIPSDIQRFFTFSSENYQVGDSILAAYKNKNYRYIIKDYSENKEDLEHYETANKYNI